MPKFFYDLSKFGALLSIYFSYAYQQKVYILHQGRKKSLREIVGVNETSYFWIEIKEDMVT